MEHKLFRCSCSQSFSSIKFILWSDKQSRKEVEKNGLQKKKKNPEQYAKNVGVIFQSGKPYKNKWVKLKLQINIYISK